MGVSLHKKSNLWRVRIWRNAREYYGGYFKTKEEALEQYNKMLAMTDDELEQMYYENKEKARYAIRETLKRFKQRTAQALQWQNAEDPEKNH